MGTTNRSAPRPVLVTAHPGHELLVHHWMETAHPIVLVFTDGSGLFGQSRIEPSQLAVRDAGAEPGPLFGIAPDKAFYAAILRRDVGFFTRILDTVTEAIAAARAPRVVSEAVEFVLPVHDLSSAIATIAARRAALWLRMEIARYEFPIELVNFSEDPVPDREVIRLDAPAIARKLAAGERNAALRGEIARVTVAHPGLPGLEIFTRIPDTRAAMPAPEQTPAYERIGRARAAEGSVSEVITYQGHVAPLVEALEQHAKRASVPAGLSAERV